MKRFFNSFPTKYIPIAAEAGVMGAWGAGVIGVIVGAAMQEKKEEEQRKQKYHAHGEIPPTRCAGTLLEFTPAREPDANPRRVGPGL